MRSLDRADIGSSDLAGIPWPAQPLNNHIFVENQAGYVDNAGDFAYDPDRATPISTPLAGSPAPTASVRRTASA